MPAVSAQLDARSAGGTVAHAISLRRTACAATWSGGACAVAIGALTVTFQAHSGSNLLARSLASPDTVTLTVNGPTTTVFRTTTDGCEANDRPDVYVHAVRTRTGVLVVSG